MYSSSQIKITLPLTMIILLVGLFLSLVVHVVHAGTPNDTLSGTWFYFDNNNVPQLEFEIFSNGGSLTGKVKNPRGGYPPIYGSIVGGTDSTGVKIVFTHTPIMIIDENGNDKTVIYVQTFQGELQNNGNTLFGTWEGNRVTVKDNDSGEWTLRRKGAPVSAQTAASKSESDAVLRITNFKNINDKNKKLGQAPGPAKLEYLRNGKWQLASVDTTLRIGDKLRTDDVTIASFEFLIGGRVGVNKGVEIEITGERSLKESSVNMRKEIQNVADLIIDILHPAGLGQRQILEIQTNGGTMSIKG